MTAFKSLSELSSDSAYDLIVIGSGVAGMSAALFAAIAGRTALVVERSDFVGGTSAFSAGSVWAPNSRHAGAEPDSIDNARRFLDAVVGNRSSTALRDAFLESIPAAIDVLEDNSEVKFRAYAMHPDYEQDAEGATLRGRTLEPLPFDARDLGEDFAGLRAPIPEFTILGGMMVDRTDIGHLLKLTRSFASFTHATRILGRYALDRMAGRRGSRLVMGNALVGRLLSALRSRKVDILLNTTLLDLVVRDRKVSGVVLAAGKTKVTLKANLGVVLASGGFSGHATRRSDMLPPVEIHSPMAPGLNGTAQDAALAIGAVMDTTDDNVFWAPVSTRVRRDGSRAVFPHFVLDRSKPGTVCVDQSGTRFVNESVSYHSFGRAMLERNKTVSCVPCFIITDSVGLRRYGLGMVRLGTRNLTEFIADGYLTEAPTIAALATALKIPAEQLSETIARFNGFAATGIDEDFGRGTTPYHRVNGDPTQSPNPTLGTLATPPYYAVRLYPGDIGATAGLRISREAQVLRADDSVIPGLYACGNDAASIMGGAYPGPGITLGPAIAFAFRAIQHATSHALPQQD
jgi:succinate dehydrogenase/fumarate reductase flavoprotein subunit